METHKIQLPEAADFIAARNADPEYWRRKAEWFRELATESRFDPERIALLRAKAAEAERRWAELTR